jgi:hypothetical protein
MPEPSDEGVENARRHFAQLRDVEARCIEVVRPIYVIEDRRAPQHLGCGVLVSAKGSTFVLTAAHVLEEAAGRQLAIAGAQHPVYLTGYASLSNVPDGMTREEDDVDAAVIPLSDVRAAALGCRPQEAYELAHPEDVEPAGAHILLFGFPAARQMNKVEGTNLSRSHIKALGIRASASVYETAGLDERRHVLTRLQRENAITDRGRRTVPKLAGMSGCGIWTITGLAPGVGMSDVRPTAKLAGIFTDYRGDATLAFGPRLNQHVGMIQHLLRS